jgi:hypothetical protein
MRAPQIDAVILQNQEFAVVASTKQEIRAAGYAIDSVREKWMAHATYLRFTPTPTGGRSENKAQEMAELS